VRIGRVEAAAVEQVVVARLGQAQQPVEALDRLGDRR
jgi:hypothetical protein